MITQHDQWQPDILGTDFQSHTFLLGDDPDYETDIVATLVRHLPTDAAEWSARPAMLFVHGMSDYFFHRHVAEHFFTTGWAVYAIDLRKCGRSWRPGQRWHHTTDLRHYFKELTLAAQCLAATHGTVMVQGHSTGGLVVALWLDHLRHTHPDLHDRISGAVLNSPWLDMMLPKPVVATLRPVVRWAGRRWPHIDVPGGNLSVYGQSIEQWDHDRALKPLCGHAKNIGWLRAIVQGHDQVHSGAVECGVPLLVLCSTQSYSGLRYTPAADSTDAVLDVKHIQRWAPTLGTQVTVTPIAGARHDVYLSEDQARATALDTVTTWLDTLNVKGAHR